jgi:hypothetical protein
VSPAPGGPTTAARRSADADSPPPPPEAAAKPADIRQRNEVAEVNDFFHWPLFRLAEELLARYPRTVDELATRTMQHPGS